MGEELARILRKTKDGKVVELKPYSGSTMLLNLEGLGLDPLDASVGEIVKLSRSSDGRIRDVKKR